MNALHSVQLLILAWAFPAVCQADDGGDISVSCVNVTGTVGEDVTLTCSVSQECTRRCIKLYKFQYPENYKDSEICKEFPHDSCEQRNSFTCRFTPATAKTERFRFFVQTQCGSKATGFTVNITEPSKPETVTEATRMEAPDKSRDKGPRSYTVIAAVVGCFFIIIIITLTIIYKRKSNSRPQWIPVFLGRRLDEDDSNRPVNDESTECCLTCNVKLKDFIGTP